jgi:uncharacterized protein involved in exopolysaccharide biosynthesis
MTDAHRQKPRGDDRPQEAARPGSEEVSLLGITNALLRWRRVIIALGVAGVLAGLAFALFSTRLYVSSAAFVPQGSEAGPSGLAAAASQLGIRVASGSNSWGPAMYVELLNSNDLLEPIVLDTIAVAERGGRRIPLMELLKAAGANDAIRRNNAIIRLRRLIDAKEEKLLGTVRLSVATPWPSVSVGIAQRLVERVNQFNLETRKSQAAAERQFVEAQATAAEDALRSAEDRLQVFLQRNRTIAGSPELAFERDRLEREVSLRQQLHTSWLQSREEARIREVRDTPVITVVEEPRLPVVGESRGVIRKAFFGGALAGIIGVLIALTASAIAAARRAPSDDAREFFELIEAVKPRFLTKGGPR